MIAGLCSEPFVLEVMMILNRILSILKIIVPLILIALIMVKISKAITGDGEKDLDNAIKSSVPKFIAAIIIFFVPTIVNTVFEVAAPESEYKDCLAVKTKADIYKIYSERVASYVKKAEQTLSVKDFDAAYGYLNHIKDEKVKEEYKNRLLAVQDKINIKEAEAILAAAESSKSETDLMAATESVSRVKDSNIKSKLDERISALDTKIQEKVKEEEAKNPTGSLPGGDSVKIPPGARPITDYVDINEVNKAIANAAKSSGLHTRAAVVAVAKTLVSTLEASNYYIPYQLGGMYHRGNLWGVNPNWGTVITHNDKQVLSGLDCRNFVHWTFKQAGLSLIRGFGYEGSFERDMDNKYKNFGDGKPGDVIDANPHLMLIVSNNGDSYTVAESNGVGRVRIWTFKFVDLISGGYEVYNMQPVYDNNGKYCPSTSEYRAYPGSCHIPESEFPSYYGL